MIKNKKDYRAYLSSDEQAFGISTQSFKDKIIYWLKIMFFSEKYTLLRYIKIMRKLEFLSNSKGRFLFDKIRIFLVFIKYRKLCIRLQINIPINTVSEGLVILHLGTIIINSGVKIGKNCLLQPGTVIGQKDLPQNVPVIGDNVYFGPGCKVIGKVVIGNNVTIAPNSVVIKDVPDNCVVSGVPAKIIKINGVKVE